MAASSSSKFRGGSRWTGLASVLAMGLALASCGILGDLRWNPGYADFGSPGARDTNRDFALSLGPVPVKLARLVMHGDAEMSAMLKGVKAVRVYTYEVDGDIERVRTRMESVRARLVAAGWQQIVAVRDDGELVAALVKMEGPSKVRGMAVIMQDDEDLTLVNVIGNIRPESFAAMMAELDIDVPSMSIYPLGAASRRATNVSFAPSSQ